jgi:hypothetical protein
VELEEMLAGDPSERVAYLCGGGAEELAAVVDLVDPTVGELLVQAGLEGDGVVAEHKGVGVEAEGHGGVAEFAYRSWGSSRRVSPIS